MSKNIGRLSRRAFVAAGGLTASSLAAQGSMLLLGAGGGSALAVPVISVAPVISGNQQVGQTLSSTTGTWANTPTGFSYQWNRAGSNIGGATSSTYVLTELDAGAAITCVVTASNVAGASSPSTSNSLLIDVYIVFLTSIVDPTDATTYSGGVWNSASLGVAATNRKIVIGIGGRASATRTLSTVLIGGQTATSAVAEVNSDSSNVQTAAVYIADVPTGTTGNVSITWSGATLRCGAGLWAVYGAASSAPSVSGSTTVDSTDVPLTLPAGAAVVGYSFLNSNTPAWSTSLSQDFAGTVEATVNHSGAHGSYSTAQTVGFFVDWATTGTPVQSTIYAAWAPAGAATTSDIIVSDGARTWFNLPSTILLSGSLYAGGVKKDGSVIVGANNSAPTTLKSTMEIDDHDNPALLARSSDGKIIAAYSKHSADNNFYVRISSSAGDVSAFGAENNIGTTLGTGSLAYANLVEVTDGIFLFCRILTGGGYKLIFSKSTDNGATWSAGTVWFNGPQRPYFQIAKTAANRFDLIINDDNPNSAGTNGIYHFYYDAGTWRKSDGTSLGAVPFTTSQFTQIWDGTTIKAWPWDIAWINGKLRAVYAVFQSTTDHRYRYASLSGGVWSDAEICTGGGTVYATSGAEDYYSGGVCLDPDDETKIYCSRTVSSVHQLYRGVTANGGATFTMTQLTFGGEKKFRPSKLAGISSLSYMTGRYYTYIDWGVRLQKLTV